MATNLQSAESPTASPAVGAQLQALLHSVAIAQIDSTTGWIRVTGPDRVRWLNGMVTNAIQTLAPGEGCYNLVLNAQGRIQGDLNAFALEESILLETDREQIPALLAHLDRFIIMDDVELADISDQRNGILIAGPRALRTVQELGGSPCSVPPSTTQLSTDISLKQTAYRGAPVYLVKAYSPLVPRFEVWADRETMAQISTELASNPKVSAEALEQLRILSGTPRYATDVRNTEKAHDLPQETAPIGVQHRALHFSKGCYLGQEIVERIRSRGNVHRTFSGFELTGALPTPGAILTADSKPVGELTSVAAIPLAAGRVQLALGYVRREALPVNPQARGLPLEYPGGTARPIALPYTLP
jgi:folate-binding protein YgfZ